MATATLSKGDAGSAPWPAQLDRDVLARCIDECLACEQSCTACADAERRRRTTSTISADAIRLCLRLCATFATRHGPCPRGRPEYVAATASRAGVLVQGAVSRSAPRSARRHADHHEHCRICAERVQALRGGLLGGTGGD